MGEKGISQRVFNVLAWTSLVVLAVFVFVVFWFLMDLPPDTRLPRKERISIKDPPQVLSTSHPEFDAIIHRIQACSRRPEDYGKTWEQEADMDGDGKPDTLRMPGPDIHLTLSNRTYRPGTSAVCATGFDDVDGDGCLDVWWTDPGDVCGCIYWGTGKKDLAGRQSFHFVNESVAAGAAFWDVDKDGDLDIVFRTYPQDGEDKNQKPSTGQVFWIEVERISAKE